jgi:probable HAF family extracellular repeat protein
MSHLSPPARRVCLAGLAAAVCSLAAVGPAQAHPPSRYPYTLVDVGTFGGPQADVGNGPYMNEAGTVVGTADTARPDPFGASESGAFNGDPFVQHAYSWHRGTLTDLGALGPRSAQNSSYPNAVNARGHAAGLSDDGTIDPLVGGAVTHAVLWKDGRVVDLGTLGGNQSQAFSLNDDDAVTGVAANAIPDAFSMLGWGTQTRAFLWRRGESRDLGTLGGPDSFGGAVNERGQVAGVSYTSSVPDPTTGQPPSDPFLWQHGRMRDLGNLGGSVPIFDGVVALNDRGQVAGQSGLAGDQTAHPYLWTGTRMIDLGTLGGDNGSASALDDHGTVVGTADLADGTHDGFLWDGRMHDLRPLQGGHCSNANDINAQGDVVGNSTQCGSGVTAVVWRHGSAVDLNTLVAPSPLRLNSAIGINDAGMIMGEGSLPNGDARNFVLIPNRRR